MTNFEDGMEFANIHGPYDQRPCNPQKAYSDGESNCPADHDVHGTFLQNAVCEDQGNLTVSTKSAKVHSVELRAVASQFNEPTINDISHKSQNVPQSNDAKAASFHGKVSFTTKKAGEEFILQMKRLQTPCTQGIVCEKLAVWTRPSQDLFPKECSVQQLLTGMLSGSQDLKFSAGKGLAFIESIEVEQKEFQQTQNGKLVTHPSENHQDAGEMSTINGGVKGLTKEKLRNKMLKNIKERKVLEGSADVQAITETGRQNPKMETNLKTRSGNASEMAAGAINPWLGLHHAQQGQVSTKQQSILNDVYLNPAAQNSIPQHQADMSLIGKPEKRKHKAELRQHPGKKMRQSVSGDSTPFVSAQPGPAIPYSVRGLSKYNMMDGEMKPRVVDDIQPLHKDTTKPVGKDGAMDTQEGNMPDFSKLF